MIDHCPGCWTQEEVATHPGTEPCPGLTCAACAELAALKEFTARLAERRFAAQDGYTMLDFLKLWCEQEKEHGRKKDAEIARLRAIQDQTASYMLERAEKYSQLVDEVIRLRALVEVGREMAGVLQYLAYPSHENLVARWRSLEGKP